MGNTKKNYKKGTRHELIKMILTCGNIPWESLAVACGNPEVKKMKIREMAKEGVLETVKVRNNRRVYTLVCLSNYNRDKELFAPYHTQEEISAYETYGYTDNKKARYSAGTDSLRVIANNEITILMYEAGFGACPSGKIKLNSNIPVDDGNTYYYTSRELRRYTGYKADVVKSAEPENNKFTEKKISNSRISGLLVSPGGIYAVYNIGRSAKDWYRSAEYKFKIFLERMLAERMTVPQGSDSAMLYAEKYDTYIPLIQGGEDSANAFDNINSAFRKTYILPYSKEGRELTRLMSEKNWKSRLLARYAPKFRIDTSDIRVDCDACMDKTYICLFMAPELMRYKRFLTWAQESYENDPGSKNSYVVICFDFQTDFVKKTAGRYCRVMTAKLSDYIGELNEIKRKEQEKC